MSISNYLKRQNIMRNFFVLLSSSALLIACGKSNGDSASGVSDSTRNANAAVAKAYDLSDAQSVEDAKRGFIAAPKGQIKNAAGTVIWDFDSFDFIKDAAPDTVNPSLWRQAKLNNNIGLFKVRDGIYQLRGFDIANITLIEGKTGWIVVDTLTAKETSAAAMAFARQHLGDKKVSAIVFTHSHVDHFGGALGVVSAEEVAKNKIPVIAPEGFMEEATSENIMVGVGMGRRANYMYGKNLQRSATGMVDTGDGKATAFGSIGILAPTLTITEANKNTTIDGVRFEFHNTSGSEAPAEMDFYLPDLKAFCGAEVAVQTMHNLYTLRGTKVRDALKWVQYLEEMRTQSAQAEVYFAQHHWPVWGHERIDNFLSKQSDIFKYIHDQTVRLINAGKTPKEIAEEVKLPKSLDSFLNAHGYYGTVHTNVKAVYQFYLGWFDANPANLNPYPPQEAGKRFIELAGGADKAIANAQKAFDKGDYRWAAEVLNHVVFGAPDNSEAKALLAKTYDQMGYQAESGVWRNFYLTGADELRNGPPKTGVTKAALLDMLAQTPTERFLESMAASVNGPKAEDLNLTINLAFSDIHESYVLTLKNAVLHFKKAPPDKQANASLTLTKPIFLKMVTGTAGVQDTLLSDDLKIEGSKIDLVRFFSLIAKSDGTFPIVTTK